MRNLTQDPRSVPADVDATGGAYYDAFLWVCLWLPAVALVLAFVLPRVAGGGE